MQQLAVSELLDRLEAFHGAQEAGWPVDPYEFLIWWHCGYPPSDAACAKGWAALEKSVGTKPEQILGASQARLATAMKAGGMVPELRADRLHEIARRTVDEFGGDLRAALVGPVPRARKLLKTFHSIADPGADRIMLFAQLVPAAAIPSNCPHVLVRIQTGAEDANYTATYRSAQSLIEHEVPEQFHARKRAYLLLKQHGQTICKRKPNCGVCPVRNNCAFAQLTP
jgi:endonuclease-3 related protein